MGTTNMIYVVVVGEEQAGEGAAADPSEVP
jgi:hypothetical protein